MSFKNIVRELGDAIGNMSRRGIEGKHWRNCTRSHIAPDVAPSESISEGQWAHLPPELLLDIIRRVEESETSWPARTVVVYCASVCKPWRDITKEIVKTPEECGRLTFPISLKQPGPRDSPIQCYIKRDRATSTFRLYFGLTPSEDESDKLLLAAKKTRRATSTEFLISLVADDFSRASSTYVGKLRSNFLGTKFTMYDSQPPSDEAFQANHSRSSRRFHTKQVSPRLPACNYNIATMSYELNVLRTRGPRRMNCSMHYIPISSIQEGGTAPTPKSFPQSSEEILPLSSPSMKGKSISDTICKDSLVLINKSPRWHEQLQCWCLNFKGRVTVASVKNFQLVASVDPSQNVPAADQNKVILQFGKIGQDIFTMDYRYPLSAYQAFAICLSSFDTKPACE
ncbi:tubby-like F-box protein 5 isoform X1 [Cynara cardunculus var. scolymus]|uniref:Tubby-like F-box protein n=1 Tax=Cynara cardunculus var. scolymus TaxID=59895 RepID=A0A103YGV2_CYNCS|nr:tubby-like F-box protein 5 isoform X1 [Cynara cardunculus var. scolymus]XP_024977781.1 tubby-like F-box protein 5 isoform X1 [Cynara cardunculus var. scolymus]KVI08830.1 F-box domain, cyclin-like protein [Cynara cardunculus var. scolymus]